MEDRNSSVDAFSIAVLSAIAWPKIAAYLIRNYSYNKGATINGTAADELRRPVLRIAARGAALRHTLASIRSRSLPEQPRRRTARALNQLPFTASGYA